MLAVTPDREHAPSHQSPTEPRSGHSLEDYGIVGTARLGDSTAESDLARDASAAFDFGELGQREVPVTS